MIQKVTTAQHRAAFLAALRESPVLVAQFGMRLALFGDLPGSGWQFYTAVPDAAVPEGEASERETPDAAVPEGEASERETPDAVVPEREASEREVPDTIVSETPAEQMVRPAQAGSQLLQEKPPLAIALRGASATVAGQFDPEELGSFLSFLGVQTVTTPSSKPPEGYVYKQSLTVYTLPAGKQLALPEFTGAAAQQGAFTLAQAPSIRAILPLLFAGEDAEVQDQYYADSCTARNHGMAQFWLLSHQGEAIFTLAASAVVEGIAYLSAGETLAAYRGQGIGGHYIAKMANEYATKGYEVCFVCEEIRCRFYNRLGFTQSGVLHQYRLNPSL